MRNHQSLHRVVLPNGITVICAENPVADLVAGRIFLKKAGSSWDSLSKAGLSHLLATVITKGTQQRSSFDIAEMVESLGASFGADTASDYWLINLKTITTDFPTVLALAAEILHCATFPEAEVELEKRLTLQALQSQREQPFSLAFEQLRQAMYPEHPYGLSILGREETILQLSRRDLIDYYQAYFRPDNMVISLSGCLRADSAIALIESIFGDWSIPRQSLLLPSLPTLKPNPSCCTISQATQQAIIMLGYLGAGVTSPDYAPLKLLSTYLGNGLSSRLFVELREKRGLAYDVSAFYPTRLGVSQFVMYMGTAPDNTAIALEGLKAEADRLCQTALSEEVLACTKNKLLGQYALGKQTNADIAQLFGWYETLGLGIEFDNIFQDNIDQVTPEDAQRVAQSYLQHPYLSLLGPADILAEAIA